MAGKKKAAAAVAEAPAKPEFAQINVQFPDNCKKNNLSVDALDSYTRELATKTVVSVDGVPLFCRAVKLVTQGGEECLQITVRPGCFEIVG